MALLDGLTDATLTAVRQFGYPVVFLFPFLEASLLFPLLPSEVILPVAAAIVVDGRASLVGFTLATTLGATVGSVFAYEAFGRRGSDALAEYGGYVGLSADDVERGQRWFRRWGENSVLWGRFLPGLRSVISIPAGLAGMDRRKFTAYSAVGSLVFNAAVGVVVYYGKQRSVYEAVVEWAYVHVPGVATVASSPLAAFLTDPAGVVVAFLVVLAVGVLWRYVD